MQSNLERQAGLHVAIIMDGNGRWGTRRGLPRTAGHRAGVDAVRRVAEAAPGLGIGTLTVFGFSSANWRRPGAEVCSLMSLFSQFLRAELAGLVESGTRLTVIGRRDRLPEGLSHESLARRRRRGRGSASICASRSTIPRAMPSPMRRRVGSPNFPSPAMSFHATSCFATSWAGSSSGRAMTPAGRSTCS